MNLVIDIGNTRCKLGVFSINALKAKYNVDQNNLKQLVIDLNKTWSFKQVIASSTANYDTATIRKELPFATFMQLTADTLVPFKNDYETPSTLGIDRIALVAAAASKYPNENVLIVDMGTCITYDFLSNDNHYKGGAISPGISMRYKAMNTYTAKLPSLQPVSSAKLIGTSTSTSMHSGVMNGVLAEIEGIITQYQNHFKT